MTDYTIADDLTIPDFLRISKEDRKKAWENFKPKSVEADVRQSQFAVQFKKRKLRKLRIEENRLRKLADDIGGRDPHGLRRVYESLKVVEKQVEEARREYEQALIAKSRTEVEPWE